MPDSRPYSPEAKADAVVLVKVDGKTVREAASILEKRYPQRSPSFQIISAWCLQDADLGQLGQERKRDLWADQIALNDLLFKRAQEEAPGLKGSAAVIGAAVGMDKEVKIIESLTGPKPTTNIGPIVIVYNAQQPTAQAEVIEGKVVE